MPRVSYIEVPPDLKDRYSQQFQPLYKTKNSSVRWNGGLIAPRKKYKITTRSLLPELSMLWNGLSDSARNDWKLAGARQGYNAWNTFVQDTSYRLKYGIPGLATPSLFHSYKVGEIVVANAGTHFKLIQEHPIQYFKMKKVKGTKSQYEPFAINEALSLPLGLGMSYRTNLTAAGPNPRVSYYAEVSVAYQGTDIPFQAGFNLPLVSGWTRDYATLASVVGQARWYTLVIELVDVTGTLQFDLLESKHTGTNFARDFRCSNINAGFSNSNYQLPPSWAAAAAVDGVEYGSVYPSDGSL